jgi:hypothetical protein
MIMDAQLLFTGNNTGGVTPSYVDLITSTGNSTNVIDLHIVAPPGVPVLASGQGARDMGIGDDPALKILVQCCGTFAGGTSLIVTLQGSPDNGSGAPLGFNTWYASPTVVLASLLPGVRIMDMDVPRPPPGQPMPRFFRLAYTVAGGPFTSTGTAAGPNSWLAATFVVDRFDQPFQGSLHDQFVGGYPPGVVIAN